MDWVYDYRTLAKESRLQSPEVGAVCGSAARADLCGGAASNRRPYRDQKDPLFYLFAAYSFDRAVIIAVIAMHVVKASVDKIVSMVTMRQRFVAA